MSFRTQLASTIGMRVRIGIVALAAAALLWIAFRPGLLYSEDCINFARSLHHFDLTQSSPQPPGYPLFVLQSRAFFALLGSPERAFLAGVILASACSFFFAVLLGREMGGRWECGITAALLFLTQPALLFSGLTSTIRIYLSAVSCAVAWCCWRMWCGEKKIWPAAALLLGIGSGYRPELIVLLFPLFALAVWRSTRTYRGVAAAVALLLAIVLSWTAILLTGVPTPGSLPAVLNGYLAAQAADTSPLYGSAARGWISMVARLASWNALAILPLLLAPFVRPRLNRNVYSFLALWTIPALIFHATVHSGAGDHALVTIVAFCVVGGIAIARLLRHHVLAGTLVFTLALMLNLRTFFRPVSMHPERATTDLRFAKEEFIHGLWDVSLPVYRSNEDAAETTLSHARQLIREARGKSLVICGDSPVFPKKVSWYLPEQLVWALSREGRTELLRSGEGVRLSVSASRRIPLNNAVRVIWIPGPSTNAERKEWNCVDNNLCWLPAGRIVTPEFEVVP